VIAYLQNTPTAVASGLVKPYAAHIHAVEEQLESGSHLILLDPRATRNAGFCPWFNLRTIRRVTTFVDNPGASQRGGHMERWYDAQTEGSEG